jgi:hypothetical protein
VDGVLASEGLLEQTIESNVSSLSASQFEGEVSTTDNKFVQHYSRLE